MQDGVTLYTYPVQRVLGTNKAISTGPCIETALARALDRLLSATVDASLAKGEELSVSEAGAREQALEALGLLRLPTSKFPLASKEN
jgi:hypothetical protein